jgi:signal transduction histidine kinase
VHDTILNDLAVVMNAPEQLDERARQRLLDDLETLRGADWIRASAASRDLAVEDAGLRNDLTRLASEFQWRGLSLHMTGSPLARHVLRPEVSDALLWSLRATLENVVRHSGATTAEVEVIAEPGNVTIMVTDKGSGFDPSTVAGDRLGLRTSVVDRMSDVGGRAQIWSAPGEGTSVIITAPATEAVAP